MWTMKMSKDECTENSNGLFEKRFELVVELQRITHVCPLNAIERLIEQLVVRIGSQSLHLIQLGE